MSSGQGQLDDLPKKQLHFVMFPWFAYGHITPYFHISNELAKRGHKITFLTPPSEKAKHRLQCLNHHRTLITLIPLHLHHVPGLPPNAETTSDVSLFDQGTQLATAFDLTRPQVEDIITQLRPDFVLYDLANWIPDITSKLGIKSVCYCIGGSMSLAIIITMKPDDNASPQGFPSPNVWPHGKHELSGLTILWEKFGANGKTFHHRATSAVINCDIVAVRTCRELEGIFCDYLSANLNNKPVLLTGPVLPPPNTNDTILLDERWVKWLSQFKEREVVYCAFGRQSLFNKEQVEEILLGLEMTGLPFFAALAPPHGCSKINDAFPDGFEERLLKGSTRGMVYDKWVQQPALLNHPSMGCFVNHCGPGTMWEAIMSHCQIVLAPQLLDQIMYTRNFTEELKMAVEVEREEENGWISKESLCKAERMVMDEGNEVGDLVRNNHEQWRKRLNTVGFMEGYVDDFVTNLHELLLGYVWFDGKERE